MVPRYGIRIAMAGALLAAGTYCAFASLEDRGWRKDYPKGSNGFSDPLWMVILLVALLLVPFIVSAVFLSRRSEVSKAAGAGVAAGLFACGFVASIAVFLGSFLVFGPAPYTGEKLIADLVFFVCTTWILVSALRIAAKAGWGMFLLSAVATVVCIAVTGHFLSSSEIKLNRRYEQQKAQTDSASLRTNYDARQILARLAGCLISYRATHPDAGFPATLDALPLDLQLPHGAQCDAAIASDGSVPNYTFTYSPVSDPSSKGFNDFRLVAMPLRRGAPRINPIAVDSRGRIFSYIGWSVTDQQPSTVPTLVDTDLLDDFQRSQILALREEIRLFMRANGGTPPAMLSKMSEYSNKSAYNETLTEGPYRLEYFPPSGGATGTYSISAVCQNYGDTCIRSFFVDQKGEVHETSEPRQPTAQDPLIPDCEKYAQTCRDIDWPQP